MSEYIKQTWVDGETPVDAEHMNHLEEGVAAAHKAIAELPETPEIPKIPVVDDTLSVSGAAADAAAVGKKVKALTEEIDELKENGGSGSDERLDKIAAFFDLNGMAVQSSNNLLNPATLTRGYYLTDAGVATENALYVYTDFIAVNEGDPVSIQYTTSAGARTTKAARWVAAYDSSKNLLSGKGTTDANPAYITPAGVAYVRLSFSMLSDVHANDKYWAIVKSETIIPYEPYSATVTDGEARLKPSAYTHIKNGYSVAVGSEWTAEEDNHDICGWNMVYRANIPNGLAGSISIGKGHNGYQGGYITVTPTTLTFYKGETPEEVETEAHGLTIKDYIAVSIAVDYSNGCKIRIATNGGMFDSEMDWAGVRKGKFFVKDTNGETADGRFSYTCHGWGAKTQIYGDSYFGVHNANRWPYYLVQDGHTDVLINGFSGRNSSDALPILKSVLKYSARPERIIWTLGMNDPDKNGAPSATWLACVERIKTICEKEAIELILTTTPLVAAVENAYKNEYVRASGYRYIDFAAAVGASSDTTWFDNMLHSDGVHPDVQGAAALYYQALADVPELMD